MDLNILLLLDIIPKICVWSSSAAFQETDYDIVSILVLFLDISKISLMMSQISIKSVVINSFPGPITKHAE
jgi:hypothetical protein